MNWKLISSLWIVGLLLEMASFMEFLGGKDVWVWIAYALSCGVIIAPTIPDRQFIHAFFTGLLVGGTLWLAAVVRSTPHYSSGPGGGFELFSIRLLAPLAGVCGGLALMLLTWLAAILVGNRK